MFLLSYIQNTITNSQNVILVVGLLFSLLVYPVYNILHLDLLSLAEVETFPTGLNQTMCNCLDIKEFSFNFGYIWTNVINVIGVKRSVFGSCGGRLVVVKKRLDAGDLRFTELNITNYITLNTTGLHEKVKYLLTTSNFSTTLEKFTLCPSLDNVDLLFNYYIGGDIPLRSNRPNDAISLTDYLQIFYIMQLSMEPIIQKITKQWAVAEYLGNCGVFTISEYCGDTLTSAAPSLEWAERASIAVQLLEFAFNATFQNPNFSFYFTDMTADNFAVSKSGKVKLVDLDNVIVVDKYPKDPPEEWETVHENYHDDSETGFTFSVGKICSHKTSDLNIYSICQGILSDRSDHIKGGLLHSPPVMSNIRQLIEKCISPSKGKTRFDIARLLIDHLSKK